MTDFVNHYLVEDLDIDLDIETSVCSRTFAELLAVAAETYSNRKTLIPLNQINKMFRN